MRWCFVVANALVLGGIGWLSASATETSAAGVLRGEQTGAAASDLGNLEARVALAATPEGFADLAGAYLDRDQPGLAAAAIDRAPADVRLRPEIAQLRVRVLLRQGKAQEALRVAHQAADACDERGCPVWLEAKAARQLAFVEQVVAAGIEDPSADPAGTQAAYERSTRDVRLVAMR